MSGAKRWVLRTVVHGRRRDIGLGSARLVSLAGAREAARALRRIARDGGDPLAARRQARNAAPGFAHAARAVHEAHAPAWRNGVRARQWLSSLVEHAFPPIGAARIDQIAAPDVLRVLTPISLSKPETARRVKQRLRAVFDLAKAAGYRGGDPKHDQTNFWFRTLGDRS